MVGIGLKGFMQLKNVPNGSLVRFENGDYALMTEYYTDRKKDGYIYGTGEALGSHVYDEWVAVIDLEHIAFDYGLMDGVDYPQSQKDDEGGSIEAGEIYEAGVPINADEPPKDKPDGERVGSNDPTGRDVL